MSQGKVGGRRVDNLVSIHDTGGGQQHRRQGHISCNFISILTALFLALDAQRFNLSRRSLKVGPEAKALM